MGGYDLYGNYYPSSKDALNAEMSQCNEIDNRINNKKLRDIEEQLQEQLDTSDNEEQIHYLWEKIKNLEERFIILEDKLNLEKDDKERD